jgi:neutral ceramidase
LPIRSVVITVSVALLGLLCASQPTDAQLQAGAAKRSIVPPFPTHMGGFSDRTEMFKGVHDDLLVRALVLDDGRTRLALIGSDLMAIDAKMVRRVRAQIQKATGIPVQNILVSCAHNHSAPSYYQLEQRGATELPLEDFLVERFTEAAVEAYQKRVPARAAFRAGNIEGATRNRQQENEEVIDTQVGVVRVEELESRKIIAILFNFTGHPVILGATNLLLSGEYPGAACRAIEKLLGGVAIFTQGACGDVTVHRSGDPFLEVERVGRLLAGEVIKAAEFTRGSESVSLDAASETLKLVPKPLPSVQEAQETLDLARAAMEQCEEDNANAEVRRQLQRKVELLSLTLRQATSLEKGTLKRPDRYEAEVQVVRVGDLVMVAVPCELFVEYALEMRARVKQTLGKHMVLVGFANGYIGFVVTPRAMATGGYEASVTRVGATAGRRITETAMDLLRELGE